MFIDQLSVFVENKPGRLAEITAALGAGGVDIRAVSISDTKDFGILRVIVNRPEIAEKALKEAGYTVSLTKVIAIGISDQPGGLAAAMKILFDNKISVEYMYAFLSKTEQLATVILRVSDNQKATDVLGAGGIKIMDAKEVYDI